MNALLNALMGSAGCTIGGRLPESAADIVPLLCVGSIVTIWNRLCLVIAITIRPPTLRLDRE